MGREVHFFWQQPLVIPRMVLIGLAVLIFETEMSFGQQIAANYRGTTTVATAAVPKINTIQFETANFRVYGAPTPLIAQEVCETAERVRNDMALLWLGQSLPDWSKPCLIRVRVGDNLGAGGSTTFVFDKGEVFDWDMSVQGSLERILDSVLPHEITHTIWASILRKQVPRWIDEGAATSVEHESEKSRYRKMLLEFLRQDVRRGLPFNKMVALTEYPDDWKPFYSQSYSTVEYLIALGGHQKLLQYTMDATQNGDWNAPLRTHYGIDNLGVLQTSWIDWVVNGHVPSLTLRADSAVLR